MQWSELGFELVQLSRPLAELCVRRPGPRMRCDPLHAVVGEVLLLVLPACSFTLVCRVAAEMGQALA